MAPIVDGNNFPQTGLGYSSALQKRVPDDPPDDDGLPLTPPKPRWPDFTPKKYPEVARNFFRPGSMDQSTFQRR
tara:strand:+ start:137 stop:358 length:222 start_codon:yes stop_codon:yes gene_type:complete